MKTKSKKPKLRLPNAADLKRHGYGDLLKQMREKPELFKHIELAK